MAGTVKRLIDELILLRSGNRPGNQHFIRAHLVLNGIDPDSHTETTADDPNTILALKKMIADFRKTI